MLLDGLLVAHGVVDRAALESVLHDPGPPRSHDHRRVMRIADPPAQDQAETNVRPFLVGEGGK